MSGVFGIVRFDGAPVSDIDLQRQMRALAHLGPDRAKYRLSGSAGLGSLNLRVEQEDLFDQQPLYDADSGITLVSDARIDNREEIATALGIAPAALSEMADSALLLAAYKRWGADCATRLIGDFVFVAWDAERGTLTLVRDHIGQRHVLFHAGEGFFAFASERNGLWALPDVPRLLPEQMIATSILLGFDRSAQSFDPRPEDGIGAVPGGTIVTVAGDGRGGVQVTAHRYWEPKAAPEHENRDEAYYAKAYREVLGEAVACRLRRALKPAGLLMGGGFDTTAICALAGPVVKAQNRKFIAACCVMPEDYQGTIKHARHWVETSRRHMPHLDVRYVTSEGLDLIEGMDQRFTQMGIRHSPARPVTQEMFRVIAGAGARTLMDGFGGDYTVNPRYSSYAYGLLRAGKIRAFVKEYRALRRASRMSHRGAVMTAIVPFLAPFLMNIRMRRQNGLSLFGPTLPIAKDFARKMKRLSPAAKRRGFRSRQDSMVRVLKRLQAAPYQGYALSSSHLGLKFTAPFHDKRVVELGLAIPESMQFAGGRERLMARKALGTLYPPEFATRPPGNDDMVPDFLAMAKRVEPQVLAEIDRMEAAGKLNQYFDFPRMRQMLTRRKIGEHASGNEYDTRQAILTFISARYVDWFRRDNR